MIIKMFVIRKCARLRCEAIRDALTYFSLRFLKYQFSRIQRGDLRYTTILLKRVSYPHKLQIVGSQTRVCEHKAQGGLQATKSKIQRPVARTVPRQFTAVL